MHSSIHQVASIYYNVKKVLAAKRQCNIDIFDLISDFHFCRVPKFYLIYFNNVYQSIENHEYSYLDLAIVVFYSFLKNEKLPVKEIFNDKYIKESLANFYWDEAEVEKINKLKEKEELCRRNIFEADMLGNNLFLDLFSNGFISPSLILMNLDKISGVHNKKNEKILKVFKNIKKLFKRTENI